MGLSEEYGPNVKPGVRLFVQLVVFVAELSRCDPFLQCLSLGGGSILVRAADVQSTSIARPYRAKR